MQGGLGQHRTHCVLPEFLPKAVQPQAGALTWGPNQADRHSVPGPRAQEGAGGHTHSVLAHDLPSRGQKCRRERGRVGWLQEGESSGRWGRQFREAPCARPRGLCPDSGLPWSYDPEARLAPPHRPGPSRSLPSNLSSSYCLRGSASLKGGLLKATPGNSASSMSTPLPPDSLANLLNQNA